MVLEKFSNGFKNIISKINTSKIDRELIELIIKEIQKTLISTDVNIRLVLELTKKIRERAIKETLEGLDKKDHLISIIYDELTLFLGDSSEFELKEGQNRLLLVGLYGQGKTTTTAKLSKYFKERGKKVCVVSLDTWRPAAAEQLKQLSLEIEVDCFIDKNCKTPIEIYNKFENELSKYDLVIYDSAGRDSLNSELVKEIEDINLFVKPTDIFLVIGADIGQNAKKQAELFKEKLNITGLIITKLDGTGKAGGALTACNIVKAPVRFIGVGEKIEDFEKFNSKKFVSQLLGMGDIETLLEKVKIATQNTFDEKKLKQRMEAGLFDLNDLYNQTKAMGKMGGITKMIGLIPGLSGMNIPKDKLKEQENKTKKWKFMLDSMTKVEKREPEILNPSRIERITKGSGTQNMELREMLKQHKMMKKMMGSFKGGAGMDEKEMENMMGDMGDPKKMMEMAKKMGMGGKMAKQFKQMRK